MTKPKSTLPELIAELDDCEQEEIELAAYIKAEKDKDGLHGPGEFRGPELGKLEDVQAHIAWLKGRIGEALEGLTTKQ